ncbi:unnamed protein product [Arctia plantaginis]|uniref:Uncharacterized protein n=1 Tax=Arctia plantaginis TaxID=874455 RepID=A0A8S1BGP9_ARCPL|nr:unnamed protein product [Arctia plantaginis]
MTWRSWDFGHRFLESRGIDPTPAPPCATDTVPQGLLASRSHGGVPARRLAASKEIVRYPLMILMASIRCGRRSIATLLAFRAPRPYRAPVKGHGPHNPRVESPAGVIGSLHVGQQPRQRTRCPNQLGDPDLGNDIRSPIGHRVRAPDT